MEAINPVRVMLFCWDSEIARDAYGPYFTEIIRKSWTLPTNRMISHAKLGKKILNTVNNDDDEVDRLDGDDTVSSQSESDDDNDSEEGEFQTPLNPVNPVNWVTENIVQQWESSGRYDYTHSGAFLDMGLGSLIDDLIESGTV
ncbi:hypothetical protein M9H77_17771 [Catharanthus roseus]|uniref:Uncharacterized protein n=1 Tax=Catharanthus roseus TaxID=4058 RepID=A0ACC0B5L2_CATRO|nr:hypothetical protein M9H77_17771 [Catharanthus roseus]